VIELLKRLGALHHADIEEELMPETGVEQMQDGMLLSADIKIDREPVLKEFRIGEFLSLCGSI
jgi:hypothetical protein